MAQRKYNDDIAPLVILFAVILIIMVMYFGSSNKQNSTVVQEKVDTIYYNVPTYTTVYEIVYPDSTYRYTCTSHIKMRLSSYRGTNTLRPNYPLSFHRNKPDWWVDNWEEPDISTTAPIRIVSESVSYKRTKYLIK